MVGCVEGMGESGNLNWYFSKNLTTNKQKFAVRVCLLEMLERLYQ